MQFLTRVLMWASILVLGASSVIPPPPPPSPPIYTGISYPPTYPALTEENHEDMPKTNVIWNGIASLLPLVAHIPPPL